MDLILWRHAAAAEAAGALDDFERRLTPRGERQAMRMGAWLNRRLPAGALVFASRAERAQATAARLEPKVRILPELDPGASGEQLLHVAGWPGGHRTVVLVGHQPALGQAAALALTGQCADWPLRKGGLWWLRRRERNGTADTMLLCAQSPETV
jgi:phosphohistidine phosphatase